jgi:hypothetical protein
LVSAKVEFLRDLAAVLEKHGAWIVSSERILTATTDAGLITAASLLNAAILTEMADRIEKQEKGGG